MKLNKHSVDEKHRELAIPHKSQCAQMTLTCFPQSEGTVPFPPHTRHPAASWCPWHIAQDKEEVLKAMGERALFVTSHRKILQVTVAWTLRITVASLAKECLWAEHLTSLPKRGVGALSWVGTLLRDYSNCISTMQASKCWIVKLSVRTGRAHTHCIDTYTFINILNRSSAWAPSHSMLNSISSFLTAVYTV